MKTAALLIALLVNLMSYAGNDIDKEYDIHLTVLEGFNRIDSINSVSFVINPDYDLTASCMHDMALESDSRNCVLLYPSLNWNIISLKGQIGTELRASKDDPNLNVGDYVAVVAQPDMSEYANADTAFIYRMELPQPYLGKYSNCIGVHLKKYAHPLMMMKVITTDAGLGKIDAYLNALLSSVRFGDAVPEERHQVGRVDQRKCSAVL